MPVSGSFNAISPITVTNIQHQPIQAYIPRVWQLKAHISWNQYYQADRTTHYSWSPEDDRASAIVELRKALELEG